MILKERKKRIRKMKYHPHGSVLFVTFSMEEGLLLLCNPLCEALIKSCLARGQFMYPVTICGILVETNHVHIMMVVDNPSDVPGFMRYFKTESSHMLNRILGRRKRTIWCESYDDPIVLTLLRAILVMAYIYSNPAKDNLAESINEYPGVSSWKMYIRGEYKKTWKRLRRDDFSYLPKDAQNLRGFTKEAHRVLSRSKSSHEFVINPSAWLEALGVDNKEEQEEIHKKVQGRILKIEERARAKRKREKKQVIGVEKLKAQTFNLTYQSARTGKRMWCLSEKRAVRVKFIRFLKNLFQSAREVQERWVLGDFSVPYPLGLYPPSMPKLAEPIDLWG